MSLAMHAIRLSPLSISTSFPDANSTPASAGSASPAPSSAATQQRTPASPAGSDRRRRREPQVRAHRCLYCPKSFFRAEHLIRHVRIHTGEKPYVCTHAGCARSFARRDELARHQKNHGAHLPGSTSPSRDSPARSRTPRPRAPRAPSPSSLGPASAPLPDSVSDILTKNSFLPITAPFSPVPFPAQRAQMVSPPPSPATIGNQHSQQQHAQQQFAGILTPTLQQSPLAQPLLAQSPIASTSSPLIASSSPLVATSSPLVATSNPLASSNGSMPMHPSLSQLVSSSGVCMLPCCAPQSQFAQPSPLSSETTFPPTPQFHNSLYPSSAAASPAASPVDPTMLLGTPNLQQQLFQSSPLQPIPIDCYTPTPEYQLEALFI